MGEKLRYNFQHLGDIVADGIEKMFGGIKSSTSGITLTYNIHDLERKRSRVVGKIGKRLVAVRLESPELDVFNNEKLAKLFTKLDNLDSRIGAYKQERADRLVPTFEPGEAAEEAPA